jgi:hypothetical protein
MNPLRPLLCWLILYAFNPCSAQEDSLPAKKHVYKCWITSKDGHTTRGYLAALKRNAISLYAYRNKTINTDSAVTFAVARIARIRFQREGAVGKGAFIGFGIGAVAGAIIGYTSCDEDVSTILGNCNKEKDAATAGLTFGTAGSLLGAAFGSSKVKFRIDGSQGRYEVNRDKMRHYVYDPRFTEE